MLDTQFTQSEFVKCSKVDTFKLIFLKFSITISFFDETSKHNKFPQFCSNEKFYGPNLSLPIKKVFSPPIQSGHKSQNQININSNKVTRSIHGL